MLGEPNLHPDAIATAKVQSDLAAGRGRRASGAIRVIFAWIHCHQKLLAKVQTSSLLHLHDMSVPQREGEISPIEFYERVFGRLLQLCIPH